MNKYTAEFADGTKIERTFAKALTHAWKVVYYTTAAGEASQHATKSGMALTKAGAEKSLKLSKLFTVVSVEIVETKDEGKVEQKAKKAPKKAKPAFVKGDLVAITLGENEVAVTARVQKIGRVYGYVNIDGVANLAKVRMADIKPIAPTPVAAEILAEAA